jgi:hypothetical protein
MKKSNPRVIGLDVHRDGFAGAILEGREAGSAQVLSTSTRANSHPLRVHACLDFISVIRNARVSGAIVEGVLIADLLTDQDKVIRRRAPVNLVGRNVAAAVVRRDPLQVRGEVVTSSRRTSRLRRHRLDGIELGKQSLPTRLPRVPAGSEGGPESLSLPA